MKILNLHWVYVPLLALFSVCCAQELRVTTNYDAPIEVKSGEDITITARIHNLPKGSDATITWSVPMYIIHNDETNEEFRKKHNSTYNEENGEVSLVVTDLNVKDNGTYYIQVRWSGNQTSSPPIQIVILVPPSSIQITGGDTQMTEEGKPYNITCLAAGSHPEVQMEWYSGSTEATEPQHTVVVKALDRITTTSVLTVTTTASDDGKEYTCVVSGKNKFFTWSGQTVISVNYKPRVTVKANNAERFHALEYQTENTKVDFECSSNAKPAVVTYKWLVDDEELADETSPILTYNTIERTMNGRNLKCVVTNVMGSGENVFPLDVRYGPRFTSTPDNQQVDIGDRVEFTCEVDGNPTPSITWVRSDNDRAIQTSSEQLVIDSVTKESAVPYQCVGTVTGFQDIRYTVYVLLRGAPSIHANVGASGEDSNEYTFSQGQTAVLSCAADVIPEPTQIIWTKGKANKPIDFSSSSRFSTYKEETSVYSVTSVLTIKDLATNDFDDYNCTIVNELGSDSVKITVTQTDNFPWKWVVIGAVIIIALAIVISVAVCCCRKRNKNKTSSAGSLSVVSNTTDSSIKKPADGMENIEISSLPEYGPRPIDVWRTNQEPNTTAFHSLDSPNDDKPELYGSLRSSPTGHSFKAQSAYPPGNYGSYRVHHPRVEMQPAPQYSTLPIRPSMLPPIEFNRFGYHNELNDDAFPEPPPEHRLATNV